MRSKDDEQLADAGALADTTASASAPVRLRYVGPVGAESPRYGPLEPGRVYPEADPDFAAYLVTTHPDHWEQA